MLDERKLKVLYAIINSYIISAEPIGSRTLSKHYDIGVSPATIRNEMSDLEELGLLNKPHSSAGRVPSDKAYRLYVDSLLNLNNISIDEEKKQKVKSILFSESQEVDQLLQTSARVLSEITNYTALVISPHLENSRIKHIQLLQVSSNQILLVIVNNSDIIKSTIFKVDSPTSSNQLNTISNFLNEKLNGLPLNKLKNVLNMGLLDELYEYKDLLNKVIPVLNESVYEAEDVELYYEGVARLLNYPEYKDINKAKTILSFIEDKDKVLEILLKENLGNEIQIVIGEENVYDQLKESSIVTATYSIDGKTIGKIGLLGPTRMDYYNLINTLRLFSVNISEILEMVFRK